MARWVRRIRAAAGLGLVWGAAWFGAGMLVLLVVSPHAADVPFPIFWGLLGFLAGALFSIVLGTIERRRSFDQMSLPRFAGWGALGGLLLSAGVILLSGLGTDGLLLGPLFALAGAGSAAGTLALARRAERQALGARDAGALLPGSSEDDDAG